MVIVTLNGQKIKIDDLSLPKIIVDQIAAILDTKN